MKKNLFSFLCATTLVATFAACSNSSDEIPQPETRTVGAYLQLDLPKTKAIEAPFGAIAATVNSLHLYFHDGTNVLKTVVITGTTTPNIASLTTGTKISDIPAGATDVTVFGNIPSSLSLPTAGTIASVKSTVIAVTSQTTASGVLLTGADKPLTVVPPSGAPSWTSGAVAGTDKYAAVTIAPAFARIEMEGLANAATSQITAYKLEGIFLNNMYKGLKLDGTADGTKQTNGTTVANYAQGVSGGTPEYKVAENGILHQWLSTSASGTPLEVAPAPGMRWAFQVVPNNANNGNDQLQIVLRLSGVAATGFTFSGDQYITVRGFKDNAGNIVTIDPGKIYTISKADFNFTENNLNPVPVVQAVGVYLKVTVTPWSVVSVKPNI